MQFASQFSKLPGAVETLSVAGQAGPRMQCYTAVLAQVAIWQPYGSSKCEGHPLAGKVQKKTPRSPKVRKGSQNARVHTLSSISVRL